MLRSTSTPTARALALLAAFATSAAAQAQPGSDQVVSLRLDPATEVTLDHQPGEEHATLRLARPPSGAVKALAAQVGPSFTGVQVEGSVDGELVLALGLASGLVEVELAVSRDPRTMTLAFFRLDALPQPLPGVLLGHVAGSMRPPPSPAATPAMPAQHPCRGARVAAPIAAELAGQLSAPVAEVAPLLADLASTECRDFATAVLAARAVRTREGVRLFHRWAYRLDPADAWPRHGAAWGFTALAAAEVLLAADLRPEAEILLTDPRVTRLKPLAPHVALGLARLDLLRGEHAQVEALLSRLSEEERDPDRLGAATGLRALAAAGSGDPARVQALATEGLARLGPAAWLSSLWVLGGEAALGRGELEESRRFFELAATSARGRELAFVRMRLGDLALRLDGERGAARARALYEEASTTERCLEGLLVLRRRVAAPRPPPDLAEWLTDQARSPGCAALRADALHALARLRLAAQADLAALDALADAEAIDPVPWASRDVLPRLEREILAAVVRRRARAHDWATLVSLHQGPLAPRSAALGPESLLSVARAHEALGDPAAAARVLLATTRLLPPGRAQDDVTLQLARRYLDADDLPRADLVLRFFLERRKDAPGRAEAAALAAERALRARDLPATAAALELARRARPPAPVAAQVAVLGAELATLQDQPEVAARELGAALAAGATEGLALRGVGVRALSLCLRQCGLAALERLLAAAAAAPEAGLLTERTRYLAGQRGLAAHAGSTEGSGSIWRELAALGAPAPAGPPRGPDERRDDRQ